MSWCAAVTDGESIKEQRKEAGGSAGACGASSEKIPAV